MVVHVRDPVDPEAERGGDPQSQGGENLAIVSGSISAVVIQVTQEDPGVRGEAWAHVQAVKTSC